MFTTYILPALTFGGLGLFSGVLLTICSKIFEVKTNERIEAINEILPQVNCGSCGFSGCSDYASALVTNGVPTNLCTPGGNDCATKISEIMGISTMSVVPLVAVVKCSGDCNATKSKYVFQGIQSCLAANRFYSGSEACDDGCLGFGDCFAVCPNDAIIITDGLARVDKAKCIGCGLCVKTCPNKLIEMHPITMHVDVCCSSTETGRRVRSICSSGCIGCKKCEKNCEFDAIKIEHNLAKIDYDKCTNCGKCIEVCPVNTIHHCSGLTSVKAE